MGKPSILARPAKRANHMSRIGSMRRLAPESGALAVLPRIIRCRDAHGHLGMDRNRFNCAVRQNLTEIPIGVQGTGFNRLELDAWLEDYKCRNGHPGQSKGVKSWDARETPASSCRPGSATSPSASSGGEFARALPQTKLGRRHQPAQGLMPCGGTRQAALRQGCSPRSPSGNARGISASEPRRAFEGAGEEMPESQSLN